MTHVVHSVMFSNKFHMREIYMLLVIFIFDCEHSLTPNMGLSWNKE